MPGPAASPAPSRCRLIAPRSSRRASPMSKSRTPSDRAKPGCQRVREKSAAPISAPRNRANRPANKKARGNAPGLFGFWVYESLGDAHPRGPRPLGSGCFDVEADLLPLLQPLERALDGRPVEEILLAVLAAQESESAIHHQSLDRPVL